VVRIGIEDAQSLAISPTGKHYAVTTNGFQLAVGDLVSGKVAFTVSFAGEWGQARFSPDGRMVAAASGNRIVLVEMATGKIRLSLDQLPARSRTLAFSADGRLLVAGLEDTTALVWDLAVLGSKPPGK
jgi:WD40 repeat protein